MKGWGRFFDLIFFVLVLIRSERTFAKRLALVMAATSMLVLSFAIPFVVLVTNALAAEEFDKYAIESASASLSSTQAGEHADFTNTIVLTRDKGLPYAKTKDIEFRLPPGLIGNPQNLPRCTVGQMGNSPKESQCPFSSQVGVSEVTVINPISGTFVEPIYNLEPPAGTDIVARLGFFAGAYPTFVNVRVDPVDYSIVASVEGAPSGAGLLEATSTLWGVPADKSHDKFRITPDEALNGGAPPEGRPAGIPPAPFMTNPTDCGTERKLTVTARSYQLPNQPSTKVVDFPEITGCGKLDFTAEFTAIPTNPEAFAPTGLDATLTLPQDESPNGLGASNLRSAVVSLPQGLTINPAAGDGLQGCGAEQVGFENAAAPACPAASKIGSAEIEVPALAKTLNGAVYQRTPGEGKGELFRFWLVTDEQGVRLKLPARIELDGGTGRVTTVFDGIASLGGIPQVPVEEFRLHIFGGPRAPLATPGCGTYQTDFSFAPWSGKAPVTGQTAMQISSGCGKGGFAPGLIAGTLNPSAGKFSPFVLTLTRQDGEANPQTIALHMPQGLLAKLAGVPLCPEPQAGSGACPAASKIGSIAASAGVGGAPLWIPQPGKDPTAAYLAGPYKGAPYSVVTVVPAQAGPFDLGLVVNRAAIYVDPNTALARIVTDPLPQILEGVPVSYRTVNVIVDRPEFTLNPTSCEQKQITATVTASDGRVAEASDSFQATDCAKLPYSPKLKLTFTGQTKRTGNPGVKAVLTQKPGQANTKAASVLLPKSQFIDNSHINNPCTRVQFNAEACPKGSILGTVQAKSPLLDQPLRGNVYFRSNGGERELPDIVADLRGQLRIILVGFVDSVKGRVRTRFQSVPDAPVSKFTMNLFAGKRSLIENSENLCKTARRAKLRLAAQNGAVQATEPVIGARCGKRK